MSPAPFRSPRLHGPLRAPRNFYDVLARLLVLKRAHGSAFDGATPTETVQAVFSGWTLCGYRQGEPAQSRHVYLLRNDALWFGFGFFAATAKPEPPTTPGLQEMLDYIAESREYREQSPWDSLDGTARLERLRTALLVVSLDCPIGATSAVEFLDIARERHGGLMSRHRRPSHGGYLADIMLNDAMADDAAGTLTAARTLAGLGRYADLVPPASEP